MAACADKRDGMQTILGAGGTIGTELARELVRARRPVRVVARNPKPAGGAEAVSADISNLDQTIGAVSGSTVVHLVVGLKYDLKVWRELWPRIMNNAIEACKRAKAKLIFFDNVYMYGKVSGRMTEETPFNPCSKKGEIRAQIATTLLDEVKAGKLNAMIVRSADFYGPQARTSVPNILVFDKFAKGATASWLVGDSVPHSYTYTPDAGKSLALLADADSAWNQTWHAPTASNPPTGKEFIRMVAKEFGVAPKYRVLSRPLIKIAGLFDSDVRESYEMLYQSDSEYLFDSTKFSKAFNFEPTTYAEGIKRTASAHRSPTA
jgi:nucleoside-diphosphate-sugar epimerase